MMAEVARHPFPGAVTVFVSLFWAGMLDARIDAIVAWVPLPPTRHHLLYAASEGLKLVFLSAIGLTAVFRLGWQPRRDIVAAE